MKNLFALIFLIMIPVSLVFGQEYGIRYSFAKDKNGKDLLREVVFYDSLNKVVMKRVDVYDFNPFMKMGYKSEFSEVDQFPRIILTGKKVSDFVPASFIPKYAKKSINTAAALDYGLVDVYACQTNPFFTLVFYDMKLMGNKKLNGIAGSLHFFDKRGVELMTFEQYDVNVRDAFISPKGRFLAHTFGKALPEGKFLNDGLRIFDRLKNQYAEISVDSAKIEKIAENYLVFISNDNAGGDVPGFRVTCIDFKKNLVYSQVYSDNYREKFHATYGDTPVFKLDGKTLTFEKDFAGEELTWKLYEKDWKQTK